MKIIFDRWVTDYAIKVVDDSGNGFYVAIAKIVESDHATNEKKRKILETALSKLTPEMIKAILNDVDASPKLTPEEIKSALNEGTNDGR